MRLPVRGAAACHRPPPLTRVGTLAPPRTRPAWCCNALRSALAPALCTAANVCSAAVRPHVTHASASRAVERAQPARAWGRGVGAGPGHLAAVACIPGRLPRSAVDAADISWQGAGAGCFCTAARRHACGTAAPTHLLAAGARRWRARPPSAVPLHQPPDQRPRGPVASTNQPLCCVRPEHSTAGRLVYGGQPAHTLPVSLHTLTSSVGGRPPVVSQGGWPKRQPPTNRQTCSGRRRARLQPPQPRAAMPQPCTAAGRTHQGASGCGAAPGPVCHVMLAAVGWLA